MSVFISTPFGRLNFMDLIKTSYLYSYCQKNPRVCAFCMTNLMHMSKKGHELQLLSWGCRHRLFYDNKKVPSCFVVVIGPNSKFLNCTLPLLLAKILPNHLSMYNYRCQHAYFAFFHDTIQKWAFAVESESTKIKSFFQTPFVVCRTKSRYFIFVVTLCSQPFHRHDFVLD